MKILIVIGTRPEAIKVAGLVHELRTRGDVDWRLCSTGQHKSMINETFDDLGIVPDYDMGVMERATGLTDITAAMLSDLAPVITEFHPDWVLVQGDTTSALAGALAAFYQKRPVGHIEAGLRTWNRYSPWPEEVNRKLVGGIATKHFAPTAVSRSNLLKEGVPADDIEVTGNTVIDALLYMRARIAEEADLHARIEAKFDWLDRSRKLILVTGHRRESFGDGFHQICLALRELARRNDIEIVYPVHLNPNVSGPVGDMLAGIPNIHLIKPQQYSSFVFLMDRAFLLLTDSGGLQEEGPSLGKPVLVMRETSERPEAIEAGTAKLVGTAAGDIMSAVTELLDNVAVHASMSNQTNPYGDGKASARIIEALLR